MSQLPPFETTILPAKKGDSPEADEMWSFVTRKKNKKWVWLVVSWRTRQVVAYAVGDRSAETCRLLWHRVPKGYRRKLVYTDFYEVYVSALPCWQHRPCGKGSCKTCMVERMNNLIRQRLGRFVRKTLSFSKCPKMHEGYLRWFLQTYNERQKVKIALKNSRVHCD
ncbi:MAG: IS1 family transposase [Armatimonadota bacterium]